MRVDDKLQALRGGEGNKEWIDFEDLGVDMLFVDEAHQFKNLAIATTISVPGVDVAAAQKCEDLFDKCEYLREAGHGSNIVFATGTPVSNSMAELYNMQRYLAPRPAQGAGRGGVHQLGQHVRQHRRKRRGQTGRQRIPDQTTVREIPQPARTDEHVPRLRGPADRRQARPRRAGLRGGVRRGRSHRSAETSRRRAGGTGRTGSRRSRGPIGRQHAQHHERRQENQSRSETARRVRSGHPAHGRRQGAGLRREDPRDLAGACRGEAPHSSCSATRRPRRPASGTSNPI